MNPGHWVRVVVSLGPILLFSPLTLPAQSPRPGSEAITEGKPYQRWLWYFRQRAFPLGHIPEGAQLRAWRQIEALRTFRRQTQQQTGKDRWVNLGPAPIVEGQLRAGETGPIAGRVADVAVDPSNNAHWLIGAAQGGIWETFDNGFMWFNRTDDQPALTMGAIAFAAGDPMIVYAGTGEAALGSTHGGAGILKSTDGGIHWVHLQSTPAFSGSAFSDLRVDPANAEVVVAAAAALGGFGRDANPPPVFPVSGIYKTTDGGLNWSRKHPNLATDLEVDPDNFSRQYAGVFDRNLINSGVFRSLNAGDSWAMVPGPWDSQPVGRIELALSPSDTQVLFVSVTNVTNAQLLGLWRTDDAWAAAPTFRPIPSALTQTHDGRTTPTPGYCGTQCFYDHEIIVDPEDSNTLYAGGIPLWRCDRCIPNDPNIRWTDVGVIAGNTVHVDQQAMAWTHRTSAPKPSPDEMLAELPLVFEANQGQADDAVRYLSRRQGRTVVLMDDGALRLYSPNSLQGLATRDADVPGYIGLRFPGRNEAPLVEGLDPLPGKVNYLLGRDAAQWHRNVPTFARVRYRDVYPGVDVVYYGNQGGLEYDLVVAPGTDPAVIHLQYQGVDSVELDDTGDLLLHTPIGLVRQKKPLVYQRQPSSPEGGSSDMGMVSVAGGYLLRSSNEAGFVVGSYDVTQPLIIDPMILYASFLGGGSSDVGKGIAVDAGGLVYVVGDTASSDFPVKNQIPISLGTGGHLFVTKLDPQKSGPDALVFSTLLGGGSLDTGEGIAVDGTGNIYVTGRTFSSNFPVEQGLQTALSGGGDAFVTKIDPFGASILYSTYLGGSHINESGSDIAVDNAGNAFVTGTTHSDDFPTRNGLQTTLGASVLQCRMNGNRPPCGDAFVTKIDTTKSGVASLVYSTFLGGGDDENAPTESINVHTRRGDIAIDSAGNIYVTGTTASADFPTRNAFRTTNSGINAFVTKIDPALSGAASLVYSTYVGWVNDGLNSGNGIAVDDNGFAYVTGATSGDFPVTGNAFQKARGALDAFLIVLDPTKSGDASVAYSTLLGGTGFAGGGTVQGWQAGTAVAVRGVGQAYITGWTRSHDFPVKEAFQPQLAGTDCKNRICYDAFVTRFDLTKAGADSLVYSSFFGGSEHENHPGLFSPQADGRIAADSRGNAYITGHTRSTRLPGSPATTPLQATGDGSSAFVAVVGEEVTRRLIVGNDGGVWSTLDRAQTWINHNTNLDITQFYDGSVHPTSPFFLLGGSQDNGSAKWDGKPDWPAVFGGDGVDNVISTSDPSSTWAVSVPRLRILRTLNGGSTFDQADTGPLVSTPIEPGNRPFQGRFDRCPHNDNLVIAGTNNLWKTTSFFHSAGIGWEEDSPDLPNTSDRVSALAFAPSDLRCSTYAFGSEMGVLRLTSDGGRTGLDGTGIHQGLPARWITDLAFQPDNANVLYVTLSGFDEGTPERPGHVFRTDNALSAAPVWVDITPRDILGQRVNQPFNTIAVDPLHPQLLFAGADYGVWKSSDGGTTWEHQGPESGMPNVGVFDLQFGQKTGRLFAFTFGRGALRHQSEALADLGVTKTDTPDPVVKNNRLTYTIEVANLGPDPATGVAVRDIPDPDTTIESVSSSQGTCEGTTQVGCLIDFLPAGAKATITLVARAPSVNTTRSEVCNQVEVSGNETDPEGANNSVQECTSLRDPAGVADLSVVKIGSSPVVSLGQDLTYTIQIHNEGPDTATLVRLEDVLPSGVTLKSVSSTRGTCSGVNPITCQMDFLAATETLTITIGVTPTTAGQIRNTATATITGPEVDPDMANNTAVAQTTVQGPTTTTIGGPTTTTTTTASTTTTVPGGSRCDTDGSGEINILDIQRLINQVLDGNGGVDLNNDGNIDVLDLQILVNVVLKLVECPDGTATTSSTATTSTTTTSSTTTTRATTTTVTTTTSTSTTTTITTTSSTTTTQPQTAACDLFGDDFNDGDVSDWAFDSTATWQLVNGQLQAGGLNPQRVAVARHPLPSPNFFLLTVDIDVNNFDGTFYGFSTYSSTQTFGLSGRTINGLGAALFLDTADNRLKVGFLGFDINNDTFVVFNATDPEQVDSLGVQWGPEGVILLVNDFPLSTIPVDTFAQPYGIPSLDVLDLYGTGGSTQVRFDNVCQQSLPSTIPVGSHTVRARDIASQAVLDDWVRTINARQLIEVLIPPR